MVVTLRINLEAAIERSRRVSPMIEAKPMTNVSSDVPSDDSDTKPTVQASNGHKPSIHDRRYRKW